MKKYIPSPIKIIDNIGHISLYEKIGVLNPNFSFIDIESIPIIQDYLWYIKKCSHTNYTYTYIEGNMVFLHRFILNPTSDLVVDHINHNGLDNRMENLRICTRKENSKNIRKYKKTKSKYKNIHWNWKSGRWYVQVSSKYFGNFQNEEDAARHANYIIKILYKGFGQLNDIEDEKINPFPECLQLSKPVNKEYCECCKRQICPLNQCVCINFTFK